MHTGRVQGNDTIPVTLDTRLFGKLRGNLVITTGKREDADPGVEWTAEYVYPGLRRGEKLKRETSLPPRATIQARDGTVMAKGEDRLSDLGPLTSEIAGRVGPAPPERAAELQARGVPADAPVGLTGLEREFDTRLAGTPGGVLFAGDRVLATRKPVQGQPVRTSIDPKVQRAAIDALAGRYGGIAVVNPRNGEVLALAGIAQSAPQPPGSTFKIVTLAGVLAEKIAKRTDTYPIQTAATLEGVEIQNANGESCGGSLRISFAHSCNSVFAPLGAQLGAEKLVETAEKFGFNEQPVLTGAARSTIPAAGEIGDDLAVGSSAIGQGKVLATPLQIALVAATIAADGIRPTPTLLKGDDATARARHARLGRPHHQELHADRRDRRDGRRRGAGRHQGLGQDGHGGAAHDGEGGATAGARRSERSAAGGGPHGHRRLVRRLRPLPQAERGPGGAAGRTGDRRGHGGPRGRTGAQSRPGLVRSA